MYEGGRVGTERCCGFVVRIHGIHSGRGIVAVSFDYALSKDGALGH